MAAGGTALFAFVESDLFIMSKIENTFNTPNLGVQWYFHMQVFDRFRNYFAIMFFSLRYVLVLPLTIRLWRYPVELATTYWFVYAIFHPYPIVSDLMVALSLLLLSPRSLCRMDIPSLVSLCALPVPLILYVLDWYLWLDIGSGNANFIFFQCMAYNVFFTLLFIDFCGATVRRDTALQLTVEYDGKSKPNDFVVTEKKNS